MLQSVREKRVHVYREYAKDIPTKHWESLSRNLSSNADTQPGVELIVAELNGDIVGSVVLFPAKTKAYGGYIDEFDYPEVRMLTVAPETRGKGVASALLFECIQRTKAKGYKSIGLHTGEFMKHAIGLYERLGFERLPQYDFEPGNDGIIVRAYAMNFE
ncbi:GNAT family N-acetyltransferase [Bacillus sp. DJP31]|uniref:GNAT family N-acetyltransferase n=1 Tax=Bacillus sp. DJP31 TaxID=3409789 RepID=UPI003BB55364